VLAGRTSHAARALSSKPDAHQARTSHAGHPRIDTVPQPTLAAPVLIVSWKRLERAVAALRRFREAGLPLALITNTIACTRAWIAAALSGAGFAVTVADVLPAPVIAAAYLAAHYPGARCLPLNSGDE